MGAISCELLQSNYSIYYTKRSIVWVIAILSVSVLIGQQVEAAMIMFYMLESDVSQCLLSLEIECRVFLTCQTGYLVHRSKSSDA